MNDAERLSLDPVMRAIVGRKSLDRVAASTSQMGRFETGWPQLHTLAYHLANFMRALGLPKTVEHWSLSTLRKKLVRIDAKAATHGRYFAFQMAEMAVSRTLLAKILRLIQGLRSRPAS